MQCVKLKPDWPKGYTILRCQLQARLVCLYRILILHQEIFSKALSCVTLGPVRLELHALHAVLERLLVLLKRGVTRRPVGEEDMVRRIEADGLREVLDGLLEVLCGERRVTLGLCLGR